MPLGNLPGRMGNFIQGAAQGTRDVAGQIGEGLKEGFGFGESEVPEDEQLYGINPRRAYWANALADFSQMAMGNPFQGKAMEGQAKQKLFQNKIQQQRATNQIGMLNALKKGKDAQDPTIIREARLLYPNDPAKQREYVETYRKKAGVEVNMGQDWQQQLMGGMMEARGEAVKANRDVRRYNAMLDLIPELGNTGPGAEAMTTFRGFLNQVGGEEYGKIIDTVGSVAGLDFFSGDQGARELFKALSNQDIIGRAKELYPVSNSDIQLLKQMTATLSGQSDPAVLESLIHEQLQDRKNTIQYYDWMRGMMPEGVAPPPKIDDSGGMDLRGIGEKRARIKQLREELGL